MIESIICEIQNGQRNRKLSIRNNQHFKLSENIITDDVRNMLVSIVGLSIHILMPIFIVNTDEITNRYDQNDSGNEECVVPTQILISFVDLHCRFHLYAFG